MEILAVDDLQRRARRADGRARQGHRRQAVVADLARMPHLLVAHDRLGQVGRVNAMIMSLLYKAQPEEVRMIMIDPKMLELSVYEGIPHLLPPVVTDMRLAPNALQLVRGRDGAPLPAAVAARRAQHRRLQRRRSPRRRRSASRSPIRCPPDAAELLEELPLIVVVIDEFADLMMSPQGGRELIARIAQKARAAGIHLILATQRPWVDVITGLIKANIPSRIAFQVASKMDATILDQKGAERCWARATC